MKPFKFHRRGDAPEIRVTENGVSSGLGDRYTFWDVPDDEAKAMLAELAALLGCGLVVPPTPAVLAERIDQLEDKVIDLYTHAGMAYCRTWPHKSRKNNS